MYHVVIKCNNVTALVSGDGVFRLQVLEPFQQAKMNKSNVINLYNHKVLILICSSICNIYKKKYRSLLNDSVLIVKYEQIVI